MHKPLALCLLLIATPVMADGDVPVSPLPAQQASTPATSEQPSARSLPVVPPAERPQTPESGWADQAANMISIFAGVTTVLLLIWKTISNRARMRREQQDQQA